MGEGRITGLRGRSEFERGGELVMRRCEVAEGWRDNGVLDIDGSCEVLYRLRKVFYFQLFHQEKQNLCQPAS